MAYIVQGEVVSKLRWKHLTMVVTCDSQSRADVLCRWRYAAKSGSGL